MSAADDIEARMRSLRATRQAQNRTDAERQAARLADGAKQAAGFIDLMRRHRIQPEPIYMFEQVKGRRPKETIDVYTPADQAWVVQFSISEYIEPSSILCLRPDGLMFSCDAERPGCRGLAVQGLIARPPKTALSTFHDQWVLCVPLDGGKRQLSPRAPYLGADDYAKAADRYLA